jgi:predicted Zn finger-like uncharacterized protein
LKIRCEGCRASFSIPDDKLPAGKAVRVACPRCQNAIVVKTSKQPEGTSFEEPSLVPDHDDLDEDLFLDTLHEGGMTALICTADPQRAERLGQLLSELGFRAIAEPDPDRAVRRLRHGGYELVVLEEPAGPEDRAHVLVGFVKNLPMAQRRESFFCLITDRERSMDSFAAFRRQVDLIIHPADLEKAKVLLEREMKSRKKFYRMFQEALNERGRL